MYACSNIGVSMKVAHSGSDVFSMVLSEQKCFCGVCAVSVSRAHMCACACAK